MSIWIAIIVLLLVAITARLFLGYRADTSSYEHLRARDVVIIEAVGDTMFPAGGAIEISADDAGVTAYLDRYFGWHSPTLRFLMRMLLLLIEQGTLIFAPSLRRFSNLPADAREQYLAGWETSNLYLRRLAFQSLRAMVTMAYLGSPEVERAIGVERPQACKDKAVV